MNKILFDGIAMQSDKRAKYHGGGEYAKFILKAAIRQGYMFDIVLNSNLFIDDDTLNTINSSNIRIIYIKDKQELYLLINQEEYTVFYSALPYAYYDYKGKAKLIGVIHGLRPLEIVWDKYKHKYYSSPLKRIGGWFISKFPFLSNILKRNQYKKFKYLLNIPNSKFIAVSNHTKYALLNFFPEIITNRIQVFYSPFDIIQLKNATKYDCSDSPFFLLVSGNRFEKNTYRTIMAFDKLFSENRLSNLNVIITGGANLPFKNEIKNTDRFKLLPYVEKRQLDELYSNAFCVVYPSMNEGFGYPPLLAMSVDTPVIASSATSIPEVCDDAVLYFSPENVNDLCNRILHLSDDLMLRQRLISRGRRRVQNLLEKQELDIPKYLKLIFDE